MTFDGPPNQSHKNPKYVTLPLEQGVTQYAHKSPAEQFLLKALERVLLQRLSEDIGRLLLGGDVVDTD